MLDVIICKQEAWIMIFYGICRFGKPLVLDMMEVDMFHTVSDRFDEIEKGLMDKIMDKSIMQEEK